MNDYCISTSEKKSLSEYNSLELRGWIIERLSKIEFQINQVIINHIKPVNCEDFERIILNPSIISFGSKIKILQNINDFDKSIIGKIRESASIRNVFAHAPIYDLIEIDIDPDINSINASNKIDKMNSQGQITSVKVSESLNQFYDSTSDILEYFSKYSLNKSE
ncbi:hypothetical protein EWU23_12635 [Cytophagaceae bacterium 50C-KIRBA]|uniref:Uncharacterized protein n=1 Tax=Aquirufa beregesia TaxID=2516556 RepID=A0ABX0EXJ5_9BACT|nr:hypothetical protein [Aquirufa beregesia]NGZ45324.1 hypothetical protein [Aquirufa beregesia]